jgi:hypothetical protein
LWSSRKCFPVDGWIDRAVLVFAATPVTLRSRGSGGLLVLARTPARTLAGDHHSLEEQLSAPDAPGLTPLQGSGEADVPHGALLAQRLGVLDVGRRLGEPQVRVVDSSGKQLVGHRVGPVVEYTKVCWEQRIGGLVPAVENSDGHVFHLLVT